MIKKRIAALLVTVAAILAFSGHANALPVYYTFEGTTYAGSDAAGAIAAAGLTTSGSAVSYTFLVDRAVEGTYRRYNGSTVAYADNVSDDYFHTALVSDHLLQNQGGGYAPYMTGSVIEEFNVGYEALSNNYTLLQGGSTTEFSRVLNTGTWDGSSHLDMADWTVGATGFDGFTRAYNSTGQASYLQSNLTLTGISSTNPLTSVPEPSTLLLLGSGLVGLGFVRRRLHS